MWIVLLSAITIIHRFLCFYVVSPTNGIASCDTCETKRAGVDLHHALSLLKHLLGSLVLDCLFASPTAQFVLPSTE